MNPEGFPAMPADPIGGVLHFAIQMHETHEAFIEAGFTEDQATQFCIAMMGLAALKGQEGQ